MIVLRRFRDYVSDSLASGRTMSHHDSIWVEVAEALGPLNDGPIPGPTLTTCRICGCVKVDVCSACRDQGLDTLIAEIDAAEGVMTLADYDVITAANYTPHE